MASTQGGWYNFGANKSHDITVKSIGRYMKNHSAKGLTIKSYESLDIDCYKRSSQKYPHPCPYIKTKANLAAAITH